MRFLSLLAVVVLSSIACAQDLTVSTFEAATVETPQTVVITKIYDEAGEPIGTRTSKPVDGEPVERFSPFVRVETEASNVTVTASDSNRVPVEVAKIKAGIYSIGGTGKIWVNVKVIDFDRKISGEQNVVVIASEPEPDPDPNTPAGSLADQAYAATNKQNDKATALVISKVYRSVAGRAAGLSAMTAQGMAAEVRSQLDQKITPSKRKSWKPWAITVSQAIAKQNLGNDKGKTIKAFLNVAKGIDRATRATGTYQTQELAPTPAS